MVMDWALVISAVGVVITVSGIVIGCFFSLTRQITAVVTRVDNLDKSLACVSVKVDVIDQRLSRLEGAFEERGRWESRKPG